MRRLLLSVGCLLVALQSHAATVYRCVDANGKMTFTQQACPKGKAAGEELRVHNPRISGEKIAEPDDLIDGSAQRVSEAQAFQERQGERHSQSLPASGAPSAVRSRVTVVGGSAPQAECSTGLNDRDLRSARLRGEIVPGMTRQQVASMYGPVNRNAPTRGAGVTTYWNDKYVSQTSVRFDANGCVESSWQSGHGGR